MLGDLAAALKAVISQRLLRTVNGARAPSVEILLNTKLISELIEKGDFSAVKEAMEQAMAEGSQSYEEHFAQLIENGTITREEGLAFADSIARRPDLNLYVADKRHPSLAGTYLAACVVAASVYKTNPVGLKYTAGLPADVAAHLQAVAWDTAQAFHAKEGRGGL
jgi:hypothetical protein